MAARNRIDRGRGRARCNIEQHLVLHEALFASWRRIESTAAGDPILLLLCLLLLLLFLAPFDAALSGPFVIILVDDHRTSAARTEATRAKTARRNHEHATATARETRTAAAGKARALAAGEPHARARHVHAAATAHAEATTLGVAL